MNLYSKYLEDNLSEKFKKSMDDYQKYLKMFFTENSRCPIDSKTILEKDETTTQIKLWCKSKSSKEWRVTITKPKIINLNHKLNELTLIYKNEGILFKDKLKQNMSSSIYNPEKDKEIEEKLKILKKYENELESVKEVFEQEKNMENEIRRKRQEVLVKLLEIKIQKNNIYKKCPMISNEVKKKLMEISKNEKNLTAVRLSQIAKNVNLNSEDVKNWIQYFSYIMQYLNENENLNNLNNEMMKLVDKFERINSYYILEPPVFDLSSKAKGETTEKEEDGEEEKDKREKKEEEEEEEEEEKEKREKKEGETRKKKEVEEDGVKKKKKEKEEKDEKVEKEEPKKRIIKMKK